MSFTYASSRSSRSLKGGSQASLKHSSSSPGGTLPSSSPSQQPSFTAPSPPNGSPSINASPVVDSGGTFANKDAVLAVLAARKKRREEVVKELGLQTVAAEEIRSEGAHSVIDAHTQEVREGERRAALEAGYVSRLVTAVTDAHRSNDSAEALKEREKEILSRRQRQKDVAGSSATSIPPTVATQIYIDDLGALLYGAQAPSHLVVGGSNSDGSGGLGVDQRALAIPPSDIYAPKRVGMRQKNAFGLATEERWSLRPPGSLSVSAPVSLQPSKHGGGGDEDDGLTTSLREAKVLETLSRTLGSALTHRQEWGDDVTSHASSSGDIFSTTSPLRGEGSLRRATTPDKTKINHPPPKAIARYEHPVPKVVSSLMRASAPTSTLTTSNHQQQQSGTPSSSNRSAVGGKSGPVASTRLVTLQELALSHKIHPSIATSSSAAGSGLPPKYSTLPNDVYGNVELEGLVIKRRILLSDAMDAALLPDGVSMSSLPPDAAILTSHASFTGKEGSMTASDPTEQRIVFNKEFPHLEDLLAVKLMSDPPPTDLRSRRARKVQILSDQPVSEPLERDELCEGMLVIHHRRVDTRTGKPAPQMVTGNRLRLATGSSSQPDPKDCVLHLPSSPDQDLHLIPHAEGGGGGGVVAMTREQAVSNLLALDREHELLVSKALNQVRKDAHQYEMARQLQAAQDARRLRVCEPIEGVRTMFYFPTVEDTDPPYLQRLQTLQSVVRNLHSRFQFQPSVREYLCGHRVGAGCFSYVHRSFQSSIFSAEVRITPRQLRNNLRGLSGGVLSDSKIKRLLFTVCPVQEGVLLETLRNAREYRAREVEERIQSVVGREQSSLQPHLSVRRLTRALSSTANLQKIRHDRITNLKQNLAKMNDKQTPPTITLPRAASLKRAPTVRFASAAKGSPNPTDPVEQLAARIRDDAWISDVETDSVASSAGLDTMLDELTAFDVDEEIRPEPTKSLGERVAMLSSGLVTKVPIIPELGSEGHALSPQQMGADIGPLMTAAYHSSSLGDKRLSTRARSNLRNRSPSSTQRLQSSVSASPFSLMMSASWASSDDFNLDDEDEYGESELEDGDELIPKKKASSPKRALSAALQAVRTILSFKSTLSDTNRRQSRNRMLDALDIKHNARRSRRPYPVGVWLNYSYPVEWVQGRLMTLLEAAVVTKVEEDPGASSHQLGPGSSNHSVLLDVYDLFLPMRLVEARAEHSMQVRKGLIPPSGATWIPPNITDSILVETTTELRALVLHERSTLAALEAATSSLAHSEHSQFGGRGTNKPTLLKKKKSPEEEAAAKKIEIKNQRQRVRFVQGRFKLLKLFIAEFHPFIAEMMGVATKAYLSATRASRASRKRTPLPNGGYRTEYQPKDFAPIPVRPKISPAHLQRFLSFPRGFIEMSLGVVSGWGCNEVVPASPPRYGGTTTTTHQDAIEPQPYCDFGGFAPTSEDNAVEGILRRMETVQGTGDGAQMAAELVAEAKDRIAAYKHRQKVERLRIKIGPNVKKGGDATPSSPEAVAKRDAMYQALSVRYNKLVGMVAVKSTVPSLDSCGPPNLLGIGGGRNVRRKGGDEHHGVGGGDDGVGDMYDLSIEEEEDQHQQHESSALGLKESLSKAQHRLLDELTVKERSHLVDAVLSGVSIRSLPTLSPGEMETAEHRKNVEMIQRHNERVSLGRALVHHLKLAHLAGTYSRSGGGGMSIMLPSEPSTSMRGGGANTAGPTGGMLSDPRVPDHLRSSSLLIAGEPLYYECFGKLLQSSPPFAMALSGVLLYVIPPKV